MAASRTRTPNGDFRCILQLSGIESQLPTLVGQSREGGSDAGPLARSGAWHGAEVEQLVPTPPAGGRLRRVVAGPTRTGPRGGSLAGPRRSARGRLRRPSADGHPDVPGGARRGPPRTRRASHRPEARSPRPAGRRAPPVTL